MSAIPEKLPHPYSEDEDVNGVRAIVWRALSLCRMPGFAERLRQEEIALLEKRLNSIHQDIVNNIRDYYKVFGFLNNLRNS